MIVNDKIKSFSLWTEHEWEKSLLQDIEAMSDEEREAFYIGLTNAEYERGVAALELDREIVSVEQWIEDEYYMGQVGRSIYRPWKDDLIELFEADLYSTAIVVGGIGSGKSTFSQLVILRMLYEASCLSNPAVSYGLAPNSTIGFCNLAMSKETARRVVFEGIGTKMHESPYFTTEFPPIKDLKNEIIFPKGLRVIAGSSNDTSIIGMNIFGGIIDEVNFFMKKGKQNRTKDPGNWGTYSKAGRLFDAVQRRMKSRYLKKGKLPGVLCVISSKTTNDSFSEQLIRRCKANPQENQSTFVRDRNIIEVKRDFFSDETFRVVIGNEKWPSTILKEDEDESKFAGAVIIEIPEDLRPDFEDNIDEALRDMAGVSTMAISPFMRRPDMVDMMFDEDRIHPFMCPLMGNPGEWDSRLPYRINWDALCKRLDNGDWVPKLNPEAKRHIHFDPASTGDAFGLAIVHIAGTVPVPKPGEAIHEVDEEQPFFVVDFLLRIVGEPGEEVLFKNVRQLCYEFSHHGFHIAEFSMDTYQCFTSDTKVKLLDGQNLTMKELAEKYGRDREFWVYSFDGSRIVPGRARNARKTGTKRVLTVELDNGEKIRCTYDHPWMLRNGKYKRASELKAGDSLMPLYTRETAFSRTGMKGYEEIYQPRVDSWELTHRMVGRHLWGNMGFNRNSLRGMLKRRGIDSKQFGAPGRNHKVLRVVESNEVEDVYDIEVDQHHNFALSAGVFVHNSREMVQALREQGYNAGIYSVDTGLSHAEERNTLDQAAAGGGEARRKQAYRHLRRAIYDGRLKSYYYPVLDKELKTLEDTPEKIDHPENGCFVGETRIPLLDGTFPMIKDLEGKEVWVYSAKPDGYIVPGKARGRLSKYTDLLLDVVLDSGAVVRCTPDHLWMLRSGLYKHAKDLEPGIDRLMPINQQWPVNGGYERLSGKNYEKKLTHHMVYEHFGEIPNGFLVHHKNEIKTDNRPENLEIVCKREHARHHTSKRHKTDEEWRTKLYAGAKKFNESEHGRTKHSQSMKKTLSSKTKQYFLKRASSHPAFRSDIDLDRLKEIVCDPEIETANSAARFLGCGRNVVVRVLKNAGFEDWTEFQQTIGNNHKVRAIIPVKLGQAVPVYDLEVDDWSNFALSCGVFVHNSKDMSDALCGACWTLFRADYYAKPIAPQKGQSDKPPASAPQHDENFNLVESDNTDAKVVPPREYKKRTKTIKPTYTKKNVDGSVEDLTFAADNYLQRG